MFRGPGEAELPLQPPSAAPWAPGTPSGVSEAPFAWPQSPAGTQSWSAQKPTHPSRAQRGQDSWHGGLSTEAPGAGSASRPRVFIQGQKGKATQELRAVLPNSPPHQQPHLLNGNSKQDLLTSPRPTPGLGQTGYQNFIPRARWVLELQVTGLHRGQRLLSPWPGSYQAVGIPPQSTQAPCQPCPQPRLQATQAQGPMQTPGV